MNKIKNNLIRSIPNLHQEMKIEHGKILSAIKPNEFQESKTTKCMELDLKNKINFSIRENITSLSSERQQPKKIKKIDGKVATIVELIKQDLLPMLNIQNERIEKLERRIKVKNESESDSDLRKTSLISDKKSNSVVESEVLNLSVSVDEIKKNLTHLDNFVKYQFLKRQCQSSEVPDNKNKSLISQIQAKLNTEINQQKIVTQETTKQLQEYLIVQLQEIKDWINQISIEQQKEIEVKLNFMETQFYQFLYQPLEVLRQIQINQNDFQIKIKELESNLKSNIFSNQIQNSQNVANCCQQNQEKQTIKINCGHFYHDECLTLQIEEDLKQQRNICCKECHKQIQLDKNFSIKISKELQDYIQKEQIKQLIRSYKMDIIQFLKCDFLCIKDQSCQFEETNCVQCT